MNDLDVLVVTNESETAASVRTVLASRAASERCGVCRNVVELRTRLAKPGSNGVVGAVLVDIDQDGDRVLYELGRLIAVHPGIRFAVLSTDFSEQLILQAMQAGARQFVRKNNIAEQLDEVLDHLLSSKVETTSRSGDVISVFSCSGGCGATTVAVNVANELHLLTSAPSLIIDLDPYYGSVASHLGIKGNYGIAHVLSREASLDAHFVKTSATRAGDGVDVLLSPAVTTADASAPMNYGNLLKAVEVCREPYRYVIIDAPRVPESVMADLASLSQAILIVFQLTVRDVAFARSRISFLNDRGIAGDRILPVANRVRKRGPLLRLRESKRAIGLKSFASIRNDWSEAVKSINHGQPLANAAGRSRLRRDFRKLAEQIRNWTANNKQ